MQKIIYKNYKDIDSEIFKIFFTIWLLGLVCSLHNVPILTEIVWIIVGMFFNILNNNTTIKKKKIGFIEVKK